jgi:hypothetical protein
LISVVREADLCLINLGAKIMRVPELLLGPGAIFRELEFNLPGQAEAILQVTSIAGDIF